jgi:Na+-translocating ferredoxin:NAD+ oxidoreductase RnfA subunit
VYGFGAAVGFSFVLVLFSSIREHIATTYID